MNTKKQNWKINSAIFSIEHECQVRVLWFSNCFSIVYARPPDETIKKNGNKVSFVPQFLKLEKMFEIREKSLNMLLNLLQEYAG
ncbi:CLUMA_CG018796, isoform A [Clunio marinus]|uniref:CLUMA_CG018796, isoform A n=1 Tax=Clunio marinus TaxID=568069 RepID=A0A1J1J0A7_9DIPT|nr:CLUMA_CG018796, isoform A [Clunio marinus]